MYQRNKLYFMINIFCFCSVLNVCKGLTFINPMGPVSYRCMDCICDTVSVCNSEPVCIDGDACGMYRITPQFWIDAGQPIIENDDINSEDAFANCAINANCSTRTVQQYMEKNKKDCNGDGKIDCRDFFRLHILGANACNKTLHENFEKRFDECDQPLKKSPIPKEATNFFLPNYDEKCERCMCDAATGCNSTIGCENGFCGKFGLSKTYWEEAGKPVLPGDDPDRRTAFEDCVLNDECAERTVKEYLYIFGKDCNGDFVTTCFDYLMINFNGGLNCKQPLDNNPFGQQWIQRFNQCYFTNENIEDYQDL